MHFNTATAAALSLGLASSTSAVAIRQTAVPTDGTAFTLMSLRSASDIHFSQFGAAHSGVFLGLADQATNAQCDGGAEASQATFVLNDGALSLYSTGNVPQNIYVDGPGKSTSNRVGFTTEGQAPPEGAQSTAWALDEYGDITFNSQGLLACPATADEGSGWTVWAGSVPADKEGCLGFSARAVVAAEPKSCEYNGA